MNLYHILASRGKIDFEYAKLLEMLMGNTDPCGIFGGISCLTVVPTLMRDVAIYAPRTSAISLS